MLGRIIKAVLDKLDRLKGEVDQARSSLERERKGDTARQHAFHMLRSPKGASTAPKKAAQAAQQRYAVARRDWVKMGGPNLLAQLATLVQAREERDEAELALKRHEEDERERLRTGIHVDVRPFLEQAYAHGALPRHFATVRPEIAAIVTDLIRWDGHDQEMVDPQSPIRDVLAVYAGRIVLKPGLLESDQKRSVPGIPKRPVRYPDKEVYIFGDLLAGLPMIEAETAFAGEGGAEEELMPLPPLASEPQRGEQDQVTDDEALAVVTADPADEATEENCIDPKADEYAMPPEISSDDAAVLRRMAEWWVTNVPEVMHDLDFQIRMLGPDASEAEIISCIEQGWPTTETPYRYFLSTARSAGVAAGRAAYVEASVRRSTLMFATKDEWREARTNNGLSW